MLSAFQTELAAVESFIEVLQREQTSLVTINVDQLIALSTEKLKQAEQLGRLAQARVAALERLGVAADRAHMEAWLADQPQELAAAWNALIEATKRAQWINQSNGRLIETQLQHNQQALNTLVSAANQSSVYGADGQPRTTYPASQRSLGKG
ncbi:FlgN protein [mine drainage metagenome]|uniref:FlgN protein n=1 Tax=mine drainage metagenome TaxID=410659 RepID=A0A1J5PRZ5_9ZZZZ